jgi:hypothetical protein
VSFELDSNVTEERDEQKEKQPLQRNLTDNARQIDSNASHKKNVLHPICVSFELDSNVNDERDEQVEKHPLQRI